MLLDLSSMSNLARKRTLNDPKSSGSAEVRDCQHDVLLV